MLTYADRYGSTSSTNPREREMGEGRWGAAGRRRRYSIHF
jgi:hypothetical protein